MNWYQGRSVWKGCRLVCWLRVVQSCDVVVYQTGEGCGVPASSCTVSGSVR